MSICLVTGSNGFIGSNLVEHLLQRGSTVVALIKNPDKFDDLRNLSSTYIPIIGDVLDRDFILKLFVKYGFHEVYHLAGQSSPTSSWERPAETMEINFSGTVNILDGALKGITNPTIVLVSSSAVYSPQKDKNPIKENSECKPVSPYGISKLAMDQLASIYNKAYGMRVLSARPFFIIGPGKLNDVCSDWIRSIVLIERGRLSLLSTGAVTGIARDFLPVSDAVTGLIKIASGGAPGEAYNICSGDAILLSTILDKLKKYASISIVIKNDVRKFRPIEELIKVGDNSKLSSLGWVQKETIENCLLETLDYWRNLYK